MRVLDDNAVRGAKRQFRQQSELRQHEMTTPRRHVLSNLRKVEARLRILAPSPATRRTIRRLSEARGEATHCTVAGNGPSLARTPLETLSGSVIAVNNCFSWLNRLPAPPIGVVVQDSLAIPELAGALSVLPSSVLRVLHEKADTRRVGGGPVCTFAYRRGRLLSGDALAATPLVTGRWGLQRSFTVVVSAVQLAVLAGFQEIDLIGCDNSYAFPEGASVRGQDRDGVMRLGLAHAASVGNHFSASYHRAGQEIYFAPKRLHDHSYHWASLFAERNGATLRNRSLEDNIPALTHEPFGDSHE
jgi:hypothetical protein